MNEEVAKRLEVFAEAAWNLRDADDYASWIRQLLAFLNVVADKGMVSAVESLGGLNPVAKWREYRDRQVGHVEGLAITLRSLAKTTAAESTASSSSTPASVALSNKVFIVHGHDVSAKESTARFLEKLDLVPVVLHEQANPGRVDVYTYRLYTRPGGSRGTRLSANET
jgi:hypothetical protein